MTETVEQRVVRESIYSHIVARGAAASVGETSRASGLSSAAVADAFRALADAHVIVLQPGTVELWSAPPFSAVPTAFRVRSGDSSWYAPCAWDAFGIPAALDRDAQIDARCSWSNDPLPCGVKSRRAFGDGVIHLEVPAARFWDDIFYT